MEHLFVCDSLALDFTATRRRRRDDVPEETLATPAVLADWLRQSGVLDAEPACGPDELAAAVAVREAIYSLVTARRTGEAYDGDALALVNDVARGPGVVTQLTETGLRTEGTAGQALSSVARDAIQILGGPDAELLKECGLAECTRVYLDNSRGGRREWCAMETCGNKMKARAYRARKKAAG